VPVAKHNYGENLVDIKTFFQEFEKQLTNSVALEVELAKEHMTNELNKTKLELGACLENNIRRLESKLDKHFENVDRSISMWREKNKDGLLKRLKKRFSNSKPNKRAFASPFVFICYFVSHSLISPILFKTSVNFFVSMGFAA